MVGLVVLVMVPFERMSVYWMSEGKSAVEPMFAKGEGEVGVETEK